MSDSYGVTRTFGCTTYSCSGFSSHEEALESVHRRAFENGDWQPPKLRECWWQFWRPWEHNELEKKFVALAKEKNNDGE